MNFYSSLKVIKEKEQKNNFSNKQQVLHQLMIYIKQLKQLVTLKPNYSSSQKTELHPLLRISRDNSIFQP